MPEMELPSALLSRVTTREARRVPGGPTLPVRELAGESGLGREGEFMETTEGRGENCRGTEGTTGRTLPLQELERVSHTDV
jgi:hypothetical protein